MVEAGGVEPPSESFQAKASTCLVPALDLAARISQEQDVPAASFFKSRPNGQKPTVQTSPLNVVSISPAGLESGNGS